MKTGRPQRVRRSLPAALAHEVPIDRRIGDGENRRNQKGGVMATTTVEAAVRDAADELLASMNAGDAEGLRRRLSVDPGAVHIGTDPDEWWSSDDVVSNLGNVSQTGVRATVDELTVHPIGEDAAWFAGTGRFVGEGVTIPVRMSGVAMREDDRFVFVHSHASVGVPNDELIA
jgi:hypothetical protein